MIKGPFVTPTGSSSVCFSNLMMHNFRKLWPCIFASSYLNLKQLQSVLYPIASPQKVLNDFVHQLKADVQCDFEDSTKRHGG